MGRARAPAINPIDIAQLIDEETLPGELNHLVGDRAVQLLASPAGWEVGKTDVLLRARAQQLMTVGETGFAGPVCRHASPVANADIRHAIAQLCQHILFRRDRDGLWSGSQHQQGWWRRWSGLG